MDLKITELPELAVAPAVDDVLPLVDISTTLTKKISTANLLASKVTANVAITPATKTKVTYDASGLVTVGADATTADIADSSDKRYCTDAQKVVIGNTSNTNTGDQTSLPLATPGAGAVSGIILALTSTETQAVGDACQIDSSGKAHLAKGDAIAHAGVIVLAAHTVSGSAANTYLTHGVMKLASSPSWTVGGLIYLSTTGTTGNTLTQTAPSGADNVIQVLGVALAADTMLFSPSLVQIEHV
jgi:hypothetical protein